MTILRQVQPTEDTQENEIATWETRIAIPLVQNIVGGIAVGALGMIGVIAYTGSFGVVVDFYNAGVWSALAGGVVAGVFTVVRFFGDDLGIVMAFYRAGQRSRDAQISALELLLSASYDAQNAVEADGGATSTIRKNQELMEQARRDAAKIIAVAFQGDNVSRSAMEQRGMGRRPWERATNLLKAAGAMDANGDMIATSPALALKAVDERVKADVQNGDKFTPKW